MHAHYSPVKYSYDYDFELLFYCPEGMKVHRATGLTVMTSRCKKDGGWTTEWPLCKGKIYNLLFFFSLVEIGKIFPKALLKKQDVMLLRTDH